MHTTCTEGKPSKLDSLIPSIDSRNATAQQRFASRSQLTRPDYRSFEDHNADRDNRRAHARKRYAALEKPDKSSLKRIYKSRSGKGTPIHPTLQKIYDECDASIWTRACINMLVVTALKHGRAYLQWEVLRHLFGRQGITQWDYISSRMIEQGLWRITAHNPGIPESGESMHQAGARRRARTLVLTGYLDDLKREAAKQPDPAPDAPDARPENAKNTLNKGVKFNFGSVSLCGFTSGSGSALGALSGCWVVVCSSSVVRSWFCALLGCYCNLSAQDLADISVGSLKCAEYLAPDAEQLNQAVSEHSERKGVSKAESLEVLSEHSDRLANSDLSKVSIRGGRVFHAVNKAPQELRPFILFGDERLPQRQVDIVAAHFMFSTDLFARGRERDRLGEMLKSDDVYLELAKLVRRYIGEVLPHHARELAYLCVNRSGDVGRIDHLSLLVSRMMSFANAFDAGKWDRRKFKLSVITDLIYTCKPGPRLINLAIGHYFPRYYRDLSRIRDDDYVIGYRMVDGRRVPKYQGVRTLSRMLSYMETSVITAALTEASQYDDVTHPMSCHDAALSTGNIDRLAAILGRMIPGRVKVDGVLVPLGALAAFPGYRPDSCKSVR